MRSKSLDIESTVDTVSILDTEPLKAHQVKALVRDVLKEGSTSFGKHAYEEMEKDDISEQDVANVLRRGSPQDGEWENGSWRYEVVSTRFTVIITFRSETYLFVVTAWRNR